VADFDQPCGDIGAHRAQPGYSDFHGSSRTIVSRDDRRSRRGLKGALQLLGYSTVLPTPLKRFRKIQLTLDFDQGEN
jgi:hypothetical protein